LREIHGYKFLRKEPDDPFSIGRGDLDPFAAGRGGGMIFDPMRTGVPGMRPDPSAGLPNRLPPYVQ
jgi:proteasome inhibitor subunit 1 (PI31)